MATTVSEREIKKPAPPVVTQPPVLSRTLWQRLRRGHLVTHLVLLGIGFFYVFPFLWMIGSSLKTNSDFFSQGLDILPNVWVWKNYGDAWTVGHFGTYFFNTVFFTVMVVILTNLFSSMSGLVLARTNIPGKGLFTGFILLTLFLPRGYTILPTFDLILKLHLNNTLWAVILVNTAGGLVFNTFLYLGYFRTIHKEIEEAAIVDGVSFPRLYWSIMLPLARPMVATVTLLTFLSNWNDFFTPLVFTLGKPELRTLAVGMYAFVGENTRDWPLLCAGAVITVAPILLVFLFLQRFFIEGIAGAVK